MSRRKRCARCLELVARRECAGGWCWACLAAQRGRLAASENPPHGIARAGHVVTLYGAAGEERYYEKERWCATCRAWMWGRDRERRCQACGTRWTPQGPDRQETLDFA